MPSRCIALLLQYDGAAFSGSQLQADRRTVQGSLEAALAALTGTPHRAQFAGRTDAGVHATGQVAALTTTSALPLDRWVRGLNHFLPTDLAVQDAREAPLHFDPRRQAVERTYRYRLRMAPQRQPLGQRQAWVIRGNLDLPRMQAALDHLVGQHDFASFAAKVKAVPTVRTLRQAQIDPTAEGACLTFRGDSFLPHQIRLTVGQMVRIGRGAQEPSLIVRLLAQPRPGAAGPSAPPQGLVLTGVRYTLPALADWNEADEDLRPD